MGNLGGGIFSIYSLVVDQLLRIPDFHQCIVTDKYGVMEDAMIFPEIINPDIMYADAGTTFRIDIVNIKRLNFHEARQIVRKFTLCEKIQVKLDEFVAKNKISKNTLGVHIRLTDMNIAHDYSRLTIQDYIRNIKKVLDENSCIDSLFIASDNDESINILQCIPEFKDINIYYYQNFTRGENQYDSTAELQINTLKDAKRKSKFIHEAFLDMLTLSHCGYFIHRVSNVANFAILYSNIDQHIYQIP